jgi:nicotinamide-nucleotide amidase
MYKISNDYEAMLENILKYTHTFLDKNKKIKGVVVGISGGIDSAMVASLAKYVASDREGFKVIGRSITITTNKPDEIARAKRVGNTMCSNFAEINLDKVFNDVFWGVRGEHTLVSVEKMTIEEKIRRGNIKARLRMILLYDLAHKENCLVLSTDNLTELLLGFWTLHGDVGDYGMIQQLFKTEVYGLANFVARKIETEFMDRDGADALRKCGEANPTDGLGVSGSDLDQILPEWREEFNNNPIHGYYEVDRILINYLNFGKNPDNPVVSRHKASEYKRNNPLNIPRDVLLG